MREKTFCITDAQELELLLDVIHDMTYDLDAIRFEQDSLVLHGYQTHRQYRFRNFFKGKKVVSSTKVEVLIAFSGVTEYALDDQARIGTGDINTIEQDADGILLVGCFPVNLRIYTQNKQVTVTFLNDCIWDQLLGEGR